MINMFFGESSFSSSGSRDPEPGVKRRCAMRSGNVDTGNTRCSSEARQLKSAAVSALKRSSSQGSSPASSAIATCGGLLKKIHRVLSKLDVHNASLGLYLA